MGVKPTKPKSQIPLKLSLAEKMVQRENFISTKQVSTERKPTARFDSNGDLSCSYSLTEVPRAEPMEEMLDLRTQNAGKKWNQERKKVIAVEMKRPKGRIGFKKLATEGEIQNYKEADSDANPGLILPTKGSYTLRPISSSYPHLSDLYNSSKSDVISPRQIYQERLTDSAVKELFVTDLPKQTKNKAITVKKSLVRRKPAGTKSDSVQNTQQQTRSGLMPILYEAVNLQEEAKQSERKAGGRHVKNLILNKDNQDSSPQYLKCLTPGLIEKSEEKVMYVTRAKRKRKISTGQSLNSRSSLPADNPFSTRSRATQKWKWMGTYGTVIDTRTRSGSAYPL